MSEVPPGGPPSADRTGPEGPDAAARAGEGLDAAAVAMEGRDAVSGAASSPDLGLPAGYEHVYSGKVRDLFTTPDGDLLFVASDRISAYDWVLPTLIPDKGAILTAMSLWWFDRLSDIVENHVISTDVPPSVRGRATVCRRLDMLPIECVARGYLTGSGLADYRATGSVCGIALPQGLSDGSALPEPIFTPATKADLGDHDENISFDTVVDTVGAADAERLRDLTLRIYSRAEEIARERGIVLADTKVEFGRAFAAGRPPGPGPEPDHHPDREPDHHPGPEPRPIVLADQVLTPDSSRFWPAESWQPGRPQESFDKQYVRDWLASPDSGWDRTSDVPPPPLPDEVVEGTRQRYLQAYRRLTGRAWSDETH